MMTSLPHLTDVPATEMHAAIERLKVRARMLNHDRAEATLALLWLASDMRTGGVVASVTAYELELDR